MSTLAQCQFSVWGRGFTSDGEPLPPHPAVQDGARRGGHPQRRPADGGVRVRRHAGLHNGGGAAAAADARAAPDVDVPRVGPRRARGGRRQPVCGMCRGGGD